MCFPIDSNLSKRLRGKFYYKNKNLTIIIVRFVVLLKNKLIFLFFSMSRIVNSVISYPKSLYLRIDCYMIIFIYQQLVDIKMISIM